MSLSVKMIAVFWVAFAVDIAYAYYIRRAAQGKAWPAAWWSGVIALAGAFNVLAYTSDRRVLIPMIAGYILGTFVAVKRDNTSQGGSNAE